METGKDEKDKIKKWGKFRKQRILEEEGKREEEDKEAGRAANK